MHKAIALLTLAVVAVIGGAGQSKSYKACMKSARTQTELTQCAGEDRGVADSEMNRVYEQLLAKAKTDSTSAEKIRAAQRAWIAFRDAELEAIFPREDKQAEYGTMYPMCYSNLAADLTRQRTAQLRRMLAKWAEGGAACEY